MTEKAAAAKRKRSRFGVGLLLYAWILLMIGGGLLFVLNDYLIAYEQSQVKYCLSDYRDALEKTLPAAADHQQHPGVDHKAHAEAAFLRLVGSGSLSHCRSSLLPARQSCWEWGGCR